MNLLELVTAAREDILDDEGGYGVDWTTSTSEPLLRWSNTQIVRYLNEAEKEIARRAKILKEAENPSITRIAVKADKASYNYSDKIIQPLHAKLVTSERVLQIISIKEVLDQGDWDTRTGLPSCIIYDWNSNKLRFNVIPTEDDTLRLIVYRYPINSLSWDSTTADKITPEIPERHHYYMIYYAAYLAYLKDEANTADLDRAEYFLNKFEEEYGPKESVYSETKKRRRLPVNSRYGGLPIEYERYRRNPYGLRDA